ncbi:Uncharacterised protein [Acinetobacter phage MD-2021a]|nr:Uncharacterised protein [Acinetobacter phage MD-2021a]CAH1089053.1 Uncharacterised protein [Acinetobacter phage MD-2021a]
MATKIENVVIKIVKMVESSGNVQFFVRATRTDYNKLFGNNLEYQCFQTRSVRSEKDCIDDAVFSVTFLLRFFGHKATDVQFVGFSEDNMKCVEQSKRFWLIK